MTLFVVLLYSRRCLFSSILITLLHLILLELALETEERLKVKEKERHQRIADNSRKMTALKSEMECKHKSLEDREKKVEETVAKVIFFILNFLLAK